MSPDFIHHGDGGVLLGDGFELRLSGLIGSIVGATLVLLLVRTVSKNPAH